MRLSLQTWNSQNINNGSPFNAYIRSGQLASVQRTVVLVNRAGEYPSISSVVKRESVIVIQILIAAGQDIDTYRETLKGYFFGDDSRHNLVANDTADSNKPYYRSGYPVLMTQESEKAKNSFFITIQTDYPYWQLVTPASTSTSITATGQTFSISNGGNLPVAPIFTITPTTTKAGGLTYRRFVSIYNNLDRTISLPLCITGSGLNTAALISDNSNKCELNGAILAGDTTIAYDTVTGTIPSSGMGYLDSEQISWTGKTGTTSGNLTGVSRGINGTSAAGHGDNTVVYLSHLQADGGDIRVWMDGGFVDYWLSGVNTTATKIWANVPLSTRQEGVTGASMTNVATTMTLSQTRTNLAFLKALKTSTSTMLLIESEIVIFDPDNVDTINYQITGLTRAQKDTSAASHASGLTVRFIEHDLFIMYGDVSLSAPETDDTQKPIFDLTSSNTSWVYTNYYDTTATSRPGSWKGEVRSTKTKLSFPYTDYHFTFADLSTELGLAEINSADFTIPHEAASLDWMLSHPAGITDVAYSGDKYSTGSFPNIAGLQYMVPNAAWITAQNESIPTATYTWESFGPYAVVLDDSYENIRFALEGVLSSVQSEMALVQFDTVTCTIASANLPTISVGSEVSINYFDVKLSNNTTSEYIKFAAPCPLNTDLVIDCEAKTAYLEDGRKIPVTLSTDRKDWLNLNSGSNTLQWDDVGTVAVTFVTAHRDRNL